MGKAARLYSQTARVQFLDPLVTFGKLLNLSVPLSVPCETGLKVESISVGCYDAGRRICVKLLE